MDEEFTICGKCGKQVPPSQFCIYCGYNLLKDRGKIQQSWEKPEEPQQFEPPAPVPIPSPEENSFSRPLAEGTIPQYTVIPLTESTSEAQVTQAWSELLKYQTWRIKLATIFTEEGIPTRVFTKIWEDYGNEAARQRGKIDENLEALKTDYEEKRAELNDAEIKLDELKVRVAIGEITESDLLIRTPSIRADADSLRSEVARLEEKMREKEASRPSGSPKEMFEHEQTARSLIANINGLVADGKLSVELGTKVGTELEEVRAFFSSMVGDPGESDLMNELETIDVRYKVGEITLAEMESLKRDVVAKLESQWAN